MNGGGSPDAEVLPGVAADAAAADPEPWADAPVASTPGARDTSSDHLSAPP